MESEEKEKMCFKVTVEDAKQGAINHQQKFLTHTRGKKISFPGKKKKRRVNYSLLRAKFAASNFPIYLPLVSSFLFSSHLVAS